MLRRIFRRLHNKRDIPRLPRPWEIMLAQDVGKVFQLAACLIFKNEAGYLKEWLDFHRLVGFEKFFLYNNNSNDNFRDVLAPYIASGVVSLFDLPIPQPAQMVAYDACLKTYRNSARWIAFIDIDEFLYARDDDSLLHVLGDYEDFPAVAVHWLMFSASGHVLKPPGLVTENYTHCQVEGNKHLRLIIKPLETERFLSPHHAIFRDGKLAVNENKIPVAGPHYLPASVARIRVNHYWTKSVQEFLLHKLPRGDVNGLTELRNVEGLLNAERLYNTGEDCAIQRFVQKLKQQNPGDNAGS